MSQHRAAAASLAVFAAAIALGWRAFLGGGHSPFYEDIEFYHHPVTRELLRAWSEWRVPLWTDRVYCGFPFFADSQTAAWYPGTLLVAALGPHTGYVAFLLLHALLAAVGMWLLVRAHGGGTAAGIAAGLLVPLSGFFGFETKHPGLFAILTWLPLWLVATRAVFLRPTPARIAVAALPLALMSAAGTLQVMFGVVLLHAFYVAGLTLDALGGGGRRTAVVGLAAVALAQALGVSLAAVVLLPTFAHFPDTARHLGMTYDFASTGSVHPVQLLGVFASGAESQLGGGFDIDFERASFYAGGLALPLACVGAIATRRRLPAVLGLAAVALAVLASGRYAGLHRLLYAWQPEAIGVLLGMGRAVGPLLVCVALLVGMGLDRLSQPSARRLLAGLLVVDLLLHAVLLALAPGWALLGSASVLAAALVCCAALRARPRGLAPALALLVAIDLLAFGAVDRVLDQRPSPPDAERLAGLHLFPALGEIASGRFGGEGERVLLLGFGAGNFTFHHGLDGAGGYNPLVTLQYLDFASLANRGELHPREPLAGFVHAIVPGRVHSGLFDAASIRFVISAVPLPWPDARLLARYGPHPLTQEPVLLYENPRSLPRAYLSYRTVRVDGPEGLPAQLGADFDPRKWSVFEGDAPALEGPAEMEPVRVGREPEQLSFEVALERPALLVVTDAWHSGWRARVDGQPAPVLRVNAHFRGVLLPAGARHVEMRFEPWTWRAGRSISLATVAILALMIAWSALRRARGIC